MMSLFSSFDTYFNFFPLLPLMLFSFIMMMSVFKFSITSILISEMKIILSFFFSLKPKMFNKFSSTLIMGTMFCVLFMNFCSVFPFSFPQTSHFGAVIMVSLMIWGSFIIFVSFNNTNGFLSHLIPEGAPLNLSCLLFLIELVSNIIRPITLSVRLVANILAGHLLIILLSKLIFLNSLIFPLLIILNLVELFVSIIQSYIFCTMISLYFSELH